MPGVRPALPPGLETGAAGQGLRRGVGRRPVNVVAVCLLQLPPQGRRRFASGRGDTKTRTPASSRQDASPTGPATLPEALEKGQGLGQCQGRGAGAAQQPHPPRPQLPNGSGAPYPCSSRSPAAPLSWGSSPIARWAWCFSTCLSSGLPPVRRTSLRAGSWSGGCDAAGLRQRRHRRRAGNHGRTPARRKAPRRARVGAPAAVAEGGSATPGGRSW